jgi:hypothetical protein
MDLFDRWNPDPSPIPGDETFLTRDDHDRAADKLSGLRAVLTAVEQEDAAPLKAALEPMNMPSRLAQRAQSRRHGLLSIMA